MPVIPFPVTHCPPGAAAWHRRHGVVHITAVLDGLRKITYLDIVPDPLADWGERTILCSDFVPITELESIDPDRERRPARIIAFRRNQA